MKLKNVIFYFPNFSEGGVESTSIKLSNYFTAKNINITFVSFKPPNKKNFRNSNLVKFKNYRNRNVNWFIKNFFCICILVKILFTSNKNNTVVFALSNLNFCILMCKLLGFKIVSRNSAPIDYFKYDSNFFEYVKYYIKCFLYPLSDLIISNSKSSAEKLNKKLAYKTKIISIPNPVHKSQNKKNNPRNNNLLYVGRLSREKGIYQLIDAFKIFHKKNKKFKLNLVGTGGQKESIKNYILLNEMNNSVNLIDWTNNLNKFYLNSKVLILPSYFEGFGNVLVEALSYSLPCISVKNDGPKEILKNGKFGLLINNNKPKTLARAINRLFQNYKLFSFKAIQGYKINNKYELKKVGSLYLKEINSVLN